MLFKNDLQEIAQIFYVLFDLAESRTVEGRVVLEESRHLRNFAVRELVPKSRRGWTMPGVS